MPHIPFHSHLPVLTRISRVVFLLHRSDRSTRGTTATLLVRHPTLNERFEVLAKVRYMERLLADDGRRFVLSRSTAVPAQTILLVTQERT
jgi:hypothetical protein